MTLAEFIAFALGVVAASVSPGPAVVAVTARTIGQGMKPGVVMSLGLVTGDLVYLVFALAGLAGLVDLIGEGFVVLKYLGAAYLVFLGWTLLRSKPESKTLSGQSEGAKFSPHGGWFRTYLSGLLITLGNPKTMVFFGALVPVLVDVRHVDWQDSILMGLTVFVISLGALLVYGAVAHRARVLVQSARSRRRLNQCAGGVLIACGATLALRE